MMRELGGRGRMSLFATPDAYDSNTPRPRFTEVVEALQASLQSLDVALPFRQGLQRSADAALGLWRQGAEPVGDLIRGRNFQRGPTAAFPLKLGLRAACCRFLPRSLLRGATGWRMLSPPGFFFGSTFASEPAGWLRESGSRLHAVQVNPLPILMRSPSCAPDGSISASLRFPAFNRYYEDTKTASVRLSRLRIPLGVRYHACFFFLGDHWREARP